MTCSSLTNDKDVVIFHFESSIVAIWKDKTICLTIHGLWAQSASNEEDITVSELLETLGEFEHLNFDSSVLLRGYTFTTCTIVISARLSLSFREDCVPFTKLDFVVSFQMRVLPFDELVVVGVFGCSNETTSPIGVNTKGL